MTIEDMIIEGSITPLEAIIMGYRWDAVVAGDALVIREKWLASR